MALVFSFYLDSGSAARQKKRMEKVEKVSTRYSLMSEEVHVAPKMAI